MIFADNLNFKLNNEVSLHSETDVSKTYILLLTWKLCFRITESSRLQAAAVDQISKIDKSWAVILS